MVSLSLHEVILYVQDMNTQIAFYADVLGLELTDPAIRTSTEELHWVTFQTGQCTLALHSGGSGQCGSAAPRFVFLVEDLPDWQRRLTELGIEAGELRSPAPHIQVIDVVDPEGNHFSLEAFLK